MSLLNRERVSIKKPRSIVLCFFTLRERGRFLAAIIYCQSAILSIHKRYSKLTKKIANYIKFFKLHYNHFTPELRFIYCVKRLFAYCFDKAPTLYLGFYINSPPLGLNNVFKYIFALSQVLKTVVLALFCCIYRLKGGVVC